MAEVSNDVLVNFKDKLRRFKHLPEQCSGLQLLVLGISRYSIDPTFAEQTGLDSGVTSEVYDILVTDQKQKLKCLLDPKLNEMVRKNQLHAGTLVLIRMSDCSVRYNEMDISGESFVIIHNLGIITSYSCPPDNSLPFCEEGREKETMDCPLVTGRGTYLPLWNSQDPPGYCWEKQAEVTSTVYFENTISICKLATKRSILKKPYPPLLVKVMHRSRLKYFSKPDKKEKWPYQLTLEVADASGSCACIVWNDLCLDLFRSVTEGTVLYLSNYTVRDIFKPQSRASLRDRNMKICDIEVSLNKQRPAGDVRVVDPGAIKPAWNLPDITFALYNRKELSSLPDQYSCDVAGVVCFVGRYERLAKAGDVSEFFLYRWIHLKERSSPQPIRLLLFATSQPQEYASIRPGKILVCTQTRLIHNIAEVKSSQSRRHQYVTTTNESQVYVHSLYGRGPCPHPRIKQLAQWATSQTGTSILEKSFAIGGAVVYPPLPTSLHKFTETLGSNIQLVSGDQLVRELNSVSFRESRQISIQGFILNVTYHSCRNAGTNKPQPQEINTSTEGNKKPRRPNQLNKKQKTPGGPYSMDTLECKVDEVWPQICERVPDVGMSIPGQDLLTRHCSSGQGDCVLNMQFTMPSNVYTCKPGAPEISVEDLPLFDSSGCLTVSIVGLNYQNVLNCMLPLPRIIPKNITLEQVLHGQIPRSDTRQSDNDIQHLVGSAAALRQKRILFVLNVYLADHNQLEILLNRGYQLDT